jgi:hypothetical protein
MPASSRRFSHHHRQIERLPIGLSVIYCFIVRVFTLKTMKLLDLRSHFGKRANSSARAVGEEELVEAMGYLTPENKRIKVYSNYGFVTKSYNFPCKIQFIEGKRQADGGWDWHIGWENAARKDGVGDRIIVE